MRHALASFVIAMVVLPAGAGAGVTYTSATRAVRAGNPSSPATFSQADLAPFSHTVSQSVGFSPACSASMTSALLADSVPFSGRVSASGDHSSGVDFHGMSSATQTIVVQVTEPSTIWLEGSWTFVQGFSTSINASFTIRPVGGVAQSLPTTSSTQFAPGSYQIDTTIGSSAGPGAITATADYAYNLRFAAVPPACAADFDASGAVGTQDIFDFLAAWFAGSATADFDHSGGLSVSDIFAFLTAWFAGC